ncbi:MAG TPA: hypothetical protein DCE80_01405 [Ignavibacteriales bacterium]|nr:hypothetical protein [Ignavibacteriales bacterium]
MEKTLEKQPKVPPYAGRKDIIKIFELIHSRNEPTPINVSKLKTHSIGSPNYVIAMLKMLGFVDDKGALTPNANDLKGAPEKFKTCLEGKVKEVYKDLFDTVKDCLNPECESEVRNYFKNHYTDVKKKMLDMYTNSFITLRDIISSSGDFKSLESKVSKSLKGNQAKPRQKPAKHKEFPDLNNNDLSNSHTKNIKLILNLNINLDIGTSKEAIEGLFKNISLAHKAVFGDEK